MNIDVVDVVVLSSIPLALEHSWIQDKEECAQWVAAPQTLRNILDACVSKVPSIKGNVLVIRHYTAYDGNLERVPGLGKLKCWFSSF